LFFKETVVNLYYKLRKMARESPKINAPIVVTFKTSNRANAKTKKKVIYNRSIDEVLTEDIPGIPKNAIIEHIGIGRSFI